MGVGEREEEGAHVHNFPRGPSWLCSALIVVGQAEQPSVWQELMLPTPPWDRPDSKVELRISSIRAPHGCPWLTSHDNGAVLDTKLVIPISALRVTGTCNF
ncbi:unnamed protein product [Meganyctiphanes norvegica]|uniref:Uncharacterized protein n=1 Tax=Meganyctiphanes norvegica TaxID=48144 RepID=A0AAV2R319_MEGNR